MSFYRAFVRPLLFRLDAEFAHHWTVELSRAVGAVPLAPPLARACFEFNSKRLECSVAGLTFKNPIGLAAGWDKSGRALGMLDAPGFGFVEIGSISAIRSDGNPRPRLFRLPSDRAIVVNYGLPNDGAAVVAERLARASSRVPLGVNIVVTNFGPGAPPCGEDEIIEDYHRSVSLVHRHAGYLMLNLSCPNAEGGKDFFERAGSIERLLRSLQPIGIRCPVFLKVAPIDADAAHERLLAEVEAFRFINGFSFNLPRGKPASLVLTSPASVWQNMPGAVSGKPVGPLIDRCIAGLASRIDRRRYAIIGAGGVFSGEDAYRKIKLGASLVQLYTALIYEGPGIVKRIKRELCRLLARDGFSNVNEAVGIEAQSRP